ncbi:MAG: lysine--tRNA ligase [Patescibacteria group bacterium]|nr:lysine--tRNA ligase [Patescibacteria group bacterium]
MTRKDKIKAVKDLKINPYPETVGRDLAVAAFVEKFNQFLKNKKKIILAGRLMSWRDHGQIIFANLKDESGQIQLVFNQTKTKNFSQLGEIFDLGDFISVKGLAFLPQSKEKSFLVSQFQLAAKTLKNFPKDYYKVRDEELLSRSPYLKTIFYQDEKAIFDQRFLIIRLARQILWQKDFVEVETPILQNYYGGALASPFETFLRALRQPLYLRIAPEIYLKKLIVGGFEKIFEIGKVFRNEGVDREHNPEFTMMELYYAYQNRAGLINFTQEFLKELVLQFNQKVHRRKSAQIEFQSKKIDFDKKWPSLDFVELIKKETGLDYFKNSIGDFIGLAQKLEIELNPKVVNKGKIVDEIYKKVVRPKLIGPVFIINQPLDLSPLAKLDPKNPNLTLRFQLLIAGLEVVNAFAELNDPVDQEERFKKEALELKQGNLEAHPLDQTFIEALEYGLPPTAGLGIGIDRLTMILTNQPSLKKVIYFPFIRED